ncbi:DUF3224 domain-containing protein [Vibrio sp. vnigr-6D03]|uniref:DUF3224 domain-containing protein n=1 Tax=Vibrio penaeicida TaxID=104609 RepID=A0AAV5P0M3_9VIBR|nr:MULTISPECIES: DUF3224 domain-containing protein [Vibrio]PKF76309.1 DUF3224 domain-containing protein [Vibrio sp. vnigr-6D03]RTZ21809.1 DUF3224 domain-containing protein [Vibrio penaeicida]GLQ76299.1 hypothetical protein GCM10007932_56620 [Vibrio penaeicida]
MKSFSGEFHITAWDESTYVQREGGFKQSLATVTQNYRGGIEGAGEIQYLMCHQTADHAVFVGYEIITGTIDGKAGCMVVQHNGKFEKGVASSQMVVVRDSGTGELKGVEGNGHFHAEESGKALYQFTLKFN